MVKYFNLKSMTTNKTKPCDLNDLLFFIYLTYF